MYCNIQMVFFSNSFDRSTSLLQFKNQGLHGADAILLEFPKKDAGGSLGAGGSSETFSEMSNEFRKQESRLIIPRRLGIL